tara:strand:+ start:180 stop:626 length:447 start_codon:yes stop_codon:yes gene_type:complete
MKEFVMRGKTLSDNIEILNFSGFKPGMGFKLTKFEIYPSDLNRQQELCATITAHKTSHNPATPDFTDEGLIASTLYLLWNAPSYGSSPPRTVINHAFIITQDLTLTVKDYETGGSDNEINWQCTFEPVKMSKAEEAVTNYKQFLISDE